MSEGFPGTPVENPFETKKESAKEEKSKNASGEILKPLFENPENKPAKANSLAEFFKSKEAEEAKLPKEEAAAEKAKEALDTISPEETQVAVEAYVEQRLPQVEAELSAAEPGSVKEAVAQDVKRDLERLQEEGDLEAPIIVQAEDAGEEAGGDIQEEPVEEPFGPEIVTFEDEEGEIALQRIEEYEDTTVASTPVSSTPTPAPSGSGGSGTPPRRPPAPAPVPPQPGPPNPNVATAPPNPDMVTTAEAAYSARQAENRGLFVGGLLGYLIGRRRGRIKTERRLLPIQKKLERQVEALHDKLEAREAEVRQISAEQHLRHHIERPASPRTTMPEKNRQETATLPESRLNLEKPQRIEHIGRAIIAAEAPRKVVAAPELKGIRPEQVRAMKRAELLALSEKIIIEGASLRQIYESHLVGERGLRRLIGEHLRGKDIRKELQHEMVEREIDFERDPLLRDAAIDSLANTGGKSQASPTLQQLLQNVGVDASQEDALTHVVKKLATQEEAHRKQLTRRKVADRAMVTLIVVLAAAVIILLLRG